MDKQKLEESAILIANINRAIDELKNFCKTNQITIPFTLNVDTEASAPYDYETEYKLNEFWAYKDGTIDQWLPSSMSC